MEKRFCAAPWHGLHINPRGDIKTCCAGSPDTGNISKDTVLDILNGEQLTEVRRLMKQGIFHEEYCQNCLHGGMEWQWHNNVNEFFDFANAPDTYNYPTIVDARWNTTCNQSCNYCDSNASSSWAALTGHPYKPETRKHVDTVIDLVQQNKDKIVEVALVGGEPLLLKENEKLLESIKDTECKVILITNLNVDLENNRIFKLLSERYEVGWSLSFDNIGERYEYVRYGGSWELHQKNINLLKNLMLDKSKLHNGGVHAVYNIYNCTRIVELKEWCKEMGLSIMWQPLHYPKDLAVVYQNLEIKKMAIAELERAIILVERELAKDNLPHGAEPPLRAEKEFYFKIRDQLLKSQDNDANLLAFTHRIETEYHPDTKGQFEKLWPEIYQALGPI